MKHEYKINDIQGLRDRFTALSKADVYPLGITVEDSPPKKRTLTQNKALHLWCGQVAEYLNESGLDMRKVMKPEASIPWTMDSVKNSLWRPIQDVMLDKESTTEANTSDYSVIYNVLSNHLMSKFELPNFPTWPSRHEQD